MAFADFIVNLVLAIVFAGISTGMLVLAGTISKIDDNNIKRALACGTYTGIVAMVMAYFPSIALLIFLALSTGFVVKFIYEEDWKSSSLYKTWLSWLLFMFLIFLAIYGLTVVLR